MFQMIKIAVINHYVHLLYTEVLWTDGVCLMVPEEVWTRTRSRVDMTGSGLAAGRMKGR